MSAAHVDHLDVVVGVVGKGGEAGVGAHLQQPPRKHGVTVNGEIFSGSVERLVRLLPRHYPLFLRCERRETGEQDVVHTSVSGSSQNSVG